MRSIMSKFLIYLIVLMVTIGGYGYFTMERENDQKGESVDEASLPVVTVKVDGIESNQMYGYTQEMSDSYMRDTVTPVPEDHKLAIQIYRYNSGIMSISYEVRSLDGSRLIENTNVESWSANAKTISATLPLNNMMNPETEYLLKIKVGTEHFGEVSYYTRIIEQEESHYGKEAKFVKEFHNATFDNELSQSIVSYIEPKASEENNNLGTANIHSSFSHITWGNLAPEKVTTPVISCKEIVGDTGSFELQYLIRAKNDYDEYQYYNVEEEYRVKWTEATMYLLDYSRYVNQEFDASSQNISGSRINAGLDSDMTMQVKADENKSHIVFVKERVLWSMDIKTNEVTKVFSFKDTIKDTDVRNVHKEHDIKIINVDINGDVLFALYGYMNRGKHEGNVGVSLLKYNSESNSCEEMLFIPYTKSYEILKESVDKLAYVSGEVMYILLEGCIYSIDLKGSEYAEVISGMEEGMYAVNASGDHVAWQYNGNGSGGGTILKEMNLKTGETIQKKVSATHRLKVLGYINNDLAYGIAQKRNVRSDENGYVRFPMEKLCVINDAGEVLKEYSKSGYYFLSADIKSNMINLHQWKKTTDGYVAVEDYQIFGNEEQDDKDVNMSSIVTERKKTELTLNFIYKVTTTSKLKVKYIEAVNFGETNSLRIREMEAKRTRYYVYAFGNVLGVFSRESDAIQVAYNNSGVVLDSESRYVWKRISRPKEAKLSDISIGSTLDVNQQLGVCLKAMLAREGVHKNVQKLLDKGNSTINIVNKYLPGRGVNLFGCSLSEVLYYICENQPVLGVKSKKESVLIIGYDLYNVIMLDPSTGETAKMGLEEAEKMFEEAGNRFLTIRKEEE